jgi:hypothetical protein
MAAEVGARGEAMAAEAGVLMVAAEAGFTMASTTAASMVRVSTIELEAVTNTSQAFTAPTA